ncbi:MAG TPA: M23 family metallopeptidase [Blastocatellia bacterium]|nr:M23 family metallopeptidase [Blastocatellia bacterium]
MTISRASKHLLVALVFASFLSTSDASAAQRSATQQDAIRSQSTNQIVGASEQKPAEQPNPVAQQKPAAEKNIQPTELAAVIPAAPNVVKRNANSIAIPAENANAEPKYEERAVTSNVERGVASTATVGSRFGYRSDPFTGGARFHSGVDIKARWGDTVGASQPGVVEFAGWYHGYGNMIVINHGGGVTTRYAHLSGFAVEVGARVARGQIVGRAGSTGRATSPHLHYELRVDGNAINPFQTLALEPSSDYFKLSEPPAETAKREQPKPVAPPLRVN